MMTEIQINGVTATVEKGVWYSDDTALASQCEQIAAGLDMRQYYPDPDLAAAAYVVSVLGGEIITVTPLPEMPPGTVF